MSNAACIKKLYTRKDVASCYSGLQINIFFFSVHLKQWLKKKNKLANYTSA